MRGYFENGRYCILPSVYSWEIIGRMRARVRDETLPMETRQLALAALRGGEEIHGMNLTEGLPQLNTEGA